MKTCRIVRVALFAFLAIVAGCSRQDFSRGSFGSGVSKTRKAPVAKLQPDGPSGDPEQLSRALEKWKARAAENPGDYLLGPGDEVMVTVYALESPDQNTELRRIISRTEDIQLPWVGTVSTTNCTVRGLEDRVRAAYDGRFIKNPQVTVQVVQFKSRPVVLTGAFKTPGIYYLQQNSSSVLELLSKAGGLAGDAAGELTVSRSSPDDESAPPEMITVNLKALLDDGDLLQNAEVRSGDILSVRSSNERFIYVLGYVQRPGFFNIRAGQQIDAMRAVAMAGGLGVTARAENSFLVREGPEGQIVTPVNLGKIARGQDAPVYLKAGDTLVVGSSFVARLTELIRPSASMPLSPVP